MLAVSPGGGRRPRQGAGAAEGHHGRLQARHPHRAHGYAAGCVRGDSVETIVCTRLQEHDFGIIRASESLELVGFGSFTCRSAQSLRDESDMSHSVVLTNVRCWQGPAAPARRHSWTSSRVARTRAASPATSASMATRRCGSAEHLQACDHDSRQDCTARALYMQIHPDTVEELQMCMRCSMLHRHAYCLGPTVWACCNLRIQ